MYIERAFYLDGLYHVFNRSISHYNIFRNSTLASHFLTTLNYYNSTSKKLCLSKALKKPFNIPSLMERGGENIIYILGYCIMPDHYHLLVKLHFEDAFSKYINTVQNSYTRYYNKMNNRKGPLWQNRFKAVAIENNSTLLHVLRYIHLNPTTAELVNLPAMWKWSSYITYIKDPITLKINKEISISSIKRFKQFTEDQIDYQKTIKSIRRKLLE